MFVRGMRENASRGFFNGSRPPYGFRKVPVKEGGKTRYRLEPEPEDSVAVKVVRAAFEMASKDMGLKSIVKELNVQGYRTSTNHRWSTTYLHKVLTNEAYCGTLVWGKSPSNKGYSKEQPPVRIENAWPAIVSQEVFRGVQEKLAARGPLATHPRMVPSSYLLSGLSKLYDALETGKLSLDDLAPRIRELQERIDELSKARIQVEADMAVEKAERLDISTIKHYVKDLKTLLEEADITRRKSFLRSFIQKIDIKERQAVIHYNLPVPPSEVRTEELVLPTVSFGGAEETRTPDPLRAKQVLSQLSYSPVSKTID